MTQLQLFTWGLDHQVIHPPAGPGSAGPRPGDRRSAYAIRSRPFDDGSARVTFLGDDLAEVDVLVRELGEWATVSEGDRCNLVYSRVGTDRLGDPIYGWTLADVDSPEVI